jgi:hypothetical protein
MLLMSCNVEQRLLRVLNAKDPVMYDRDTDRQNSPTFFAKFLPSSLQPEHRALVDESGTIITQMGRTVD